MTLAEDIAFWTKQMNATKHDKLAMTCFGIVTGLKMAQKEYGVPLDAVSAPPALIASHQDREG